MALANFQGSAPTQGAKFEADFCEVLVWHGFMEIQRKQWATDVAVEVDIVAHNAHGFAIPFSCVGSWMSERNGMERTDSVKKKAGDGALFITSEMGSMMPPLVIATNAIPRDKAAAAGIRAALRGNYWLDILLITEAKKLKWLFQATEEDIQCKLDQNRRLPLQPMDHRRNAFRPSLYTKPWNGCG